MYNFRDLHAAAERMHALANLLNNPVDAAIAHEYADELKRKACEDCGGPDTPLFWFRQKKNEPFTGMLRQTLDRLYPVPEDQAFDKLLIALH